MNKIKAVIVEDIENARIYLKDQLATHFHSLELVGEAASILEAAKVIGKTKPDVIFLDISLEDGSGFDLLDIFPNLEAKIIFTTASEAHAIKAFRIAAVDYLMKPLSTEQLREAIQKLESSIGQNNKASLDLLRETIKFPNQKPNKISLSTSDSIHVVNIKEIIRCEADVNLTFVYLENGEKIIVTKSLKQIQNILEEHNFIRSHQSHLVNLEFIKAYNRNDGGYIVLRNGKEIPVSVRKKKEIMELLKMQVLGIT